MDKISVLIVDDDPAMVMTLTAILNHKGFEASGAEGGKMALKMIKKNDFRMILSDVLMPEMNGLELFRAVRRIKPEQKLLLMTAYTSEQNISTALGEGALGCLTKPLDIDMLVSILSK